VRAIKTSVVRPSAMLAPRPKAAHDLPVQAGARPLPALYTPPLLTSLVIRHSSNDSAALKGPSAYDTLLTVPPRHKVRRKQRRVVALVKDVIQARTTMQQTIPCSPNAIATRTVQAYACSIDLHEAGDQ
jgi:hypothetical protein